MSVVEAATLIGLCKNPSLFNPVRYPERCLNRRNVVLSQMQKAGYLSTAEYNQLCDEKLVLDFHRVDHKDGIATYFREFLRQYMMARRPDLNDYPAWNKRQYVIDSIAWNNDPLYGWCNKNFKRDGKPYNIYTDGLKIMTTIDSRMQKYAEEAVFAQVAKNLQPAFNRANKSKRNAPFSDNLTSKQVREIMHRAMVQSERYRVLKSKGLSEDEIKQSFRTKVDMTLFSYHGDIDTVMTPMDSIRYVKSFLRTGFMSMDGLTGQVKAYVGGMNYNHFMYDMVMGGRRQIGSTIKPFLYALAMEMVLVLVIR